MIDIDKFRVLAEHYGLDLVMEQNDLEPEDVIKLLYENGLIDIEDYWFDVIEDEDHDA